MSRIPPQGKSFILPKGNNLTNERQQISTYQAPLP